MPSAIARDLSRYGLRRWDVTRGIQRMHRRMEQEVGENIIEKHGHKWKLIPRLRRDFAAARGE